MFAAGLLGTFGRNKDGLGGNAKERSELALQRSPEADRRLDGDDDGLDLDAWAFFAAGAIFATRTAVAFRAGATITFGAGLATRTTFAFGARFTTRTVALRDAGLTAFFGDEAFGTRFAGFATRAVTLRDARLARFALLTRLTLLARLRRRLLGEATREVLGKLRRIFDDAAGWAGSLTIGGRSGATGCTATTELLRRGDGSGFRGGFTGSTDH